MKLDFISDAIDSVGNAIDSIFTSDEERGEIEVKLKTVKLDLEKLKHDLLTKGIELEGKVIEANAKIAIAEQQSGSWISKNWRPICSLSSFILLSLMGFKVIEFNEFLATIFGSMIGYHGVLRSLVDKKSK